MLRLLICGSCGGPLPRPSNDRFVTCQFCGATSSLETGAPLERVQVKELSVVDFKARLKRELDTFEGAYRERSAQGEPPATAFRAAAESALSNLCDPDAITNVVFGLAADFERAHGADVTRDPNALPRLATAYLDALEQLQNKREHEINVPFLTTTTSGPLHFRLHVTIERLEELSRTPPAPRQPPEPAKPAQRDEPALAPRPWWKRLLSWGLGLAS